MKEEGDLQQRKMARSGRADTAAVLTVRAVTSTNSEHPSSAVTQTRRRHGAPSEAGEEKGERQIATVKTCTNAKKNKREGGGVEN